MSDFTFMACFTFMWSCSVAVAVTLHGNDALLAALFGTVILAILKGFKE